MVNKKSSDPYGISELKNKKKMQEKQFDELLNAIKDISNELKSINKRLDDIENKPSNEK